MSPRGWPADLSDGPVRLRPLRRRDQRAWCDVRNRNLDWLMPWESTLPPEPMSRALVSVSSGSADGATYRGMLRSLRRQARDGSTLPFAIEFNRRFVGQVTVSSIVRGSLQSASVGYWLDQGVAG